MQIFEYRTFECNIIIYLLSYFIERIIYFASISQTDASFPLFNDNVLELFEKLNNLKETKKSLLSDTSDKIRRTTNLIIKAENARFCNSGGLLHCFNEIIKMNEELKVNHNIRLKNAEEIKNTLNEIYSILQSAANLKGM